MYKSDLHSPARKNRSFIRTLVKRYKIFFVKTKTYLEKSEER